MCACACVRVCVDIYVDIYRVRLNHVHYKRRWREHLQLEDRIIVPDEKAGQVFTSKEHASDCKDKWARRKAYTA